jgi:hypothetical protein
MPGGLARAGDTLVQGLVAGEPDHSSLQYNGEAYVDVTYDDANHEVTAVTLGNHMVVGKRKWFVTAGEENLDGTLTVEVCTETYEQRNGWLTDRGFWMVGGKTEMENLWAVYLNNVAKANACNCKYSKVNTVTTNVNSPNPWR